MFQDYGIGVSGPKFNPYEDTNTIPERWRVWRTNFQYHIDGQVGLSDKQKVARLLHQAGSELQEVYESIKDVEVEGITEYEKCVKRLNLHLDPEVNTNYERQKFRNLCKEEKELMEQFILRLRKQARYCRFSNVDEALLDQLIEKCTDFNLKRKERNRINIK